jgi:hypothetical protein
VRRFASVTYDSELAPDERAAASQELASAGAAPTSWICAAGRTYASVAFRSGARFAHERLPGARCDEPALAVLRVTPLAPRGLAPLHRALGGPGRPAGIVDVRADGPALIVELETTRTPLALVVAAIDAELGSSPGRTIEPLLPLDDATLTAFVATQLGEPALDVSRLVETHLEPLLGAGP